MEFTDITNTIALETERIKKTDLPKVHLSELEPLDFKKQKNSLKEQVKILVSGNPALEDFARGVYHVLKGKPKQYVVPGDNILNLSLEELMIPDGQEFVEAAYQKILGVNGDAEGIRYHTILLEDGKMEKEEILYAFMISDDGKKRHVYIHGLEDRLHQVLKEKRHKKK